MSEKLTVSVFLKSFYLDPKEYRDFYWVLFTRFLEQMGVYPKLLSRRLVSLWLRGKQPPSGLRYLFLLFDHMRYCVLPFLQFFMKDIVKSDEPEFYSSIMIAVLVITSIPSSIVAGMLNV